MADAKTQTAKELAAEASQRFGRLVDEAETVAAYAKKTGDVCYVCFEIRYEVEGDRRMMAATYEVTGPDHIDCRTHRPEKALDFIHQYATGDADPTAELRTQAVAQHEEETGERRWYHVRGIHDEQDFEALVEGESAAYVNEFVAELREHGPLADYIIKEIAADIAKTLEDKGLAAFRPTRRS